VLPWGEAVVWVNLTADTNARTIKVGADANVPTHANLGVLPNFVQNLYAWTEIVFDGINSVLDTSGWPIGHNGNNLPLQAGYTTADNTEYQFNAPTKPPLSELLGGPWANSSEPPYKLDGPIYEISIPLYPGCNLISSPVIPIFGTYAAYYTQSYTGQEHSGIPFALLFNMTSASETIEAIWYYKAGAESWAYYIPGVSADTGITEDATFKDGRGYWIKAEKSCTLELSGVQMENAPFVSPEYDVFHSWNLLGFTSMYQWLLPTTSNPQHRLHRHRHTCHDGQCCGTSMGVRRFSGCLDKRSRNTLARPRLLGELQARRQSRSSAIKSL